MKQEETRLRLIEGAIHVIAENGLDKTTTKLIGKETGINEVYIYRIFEDKEDLLANAFAKLDEELLEVVMQNIVVMYIKELDYETRCRYFFNAVWKCILQDRDDCVAYVRYFYSPYFKKHSAEEHKQRFEVFMERARPAFKEEANLWMILSHILNVMLDFAIKVFDGEMPEDDDYYEHVFRVIYHSVEQYFK